MPVVYGTCHGAHLLRRVMPCARRAQDPQPNPRSPQPISCVDPLVEMASFCVRAHALAHGARTRRPLYL